MGQKQIEKTFGDALAGLGFDEATLFLPDHADGDLGQIADHAFDVAAMIADLRVLGGFDLEKRSADELRQPPGDFRFADAGRSDHDDVLGRDVLCAGRQAVAVVASDCGWR